MIFETNRNRGTLFSQAIDGIILIKVMKLNGGAHYKMIMEFQCQMAIVSRTHNFMQFLPWANTDCPSSEHSAQIAA